jgi:hypothetical protein
VTAKKQEGKALKFTVLKTQEKKESFSFLIVPVKVPGWPLMGQAFILILEPITRIPLVQAQSWSKRNEISST